MSSYPAPQTTQRPSDLRAVIRSGLEPAFAPTLETVLASFPHLPTRTAILGLGRDGLPVLFDLRDDRPGAILISADQVSGKTSLLQSLLVSSLALSLPHEVQTVVIAADRLQWEWLDQDLAANRYLLDVASVHEPAAAGWILRLASMAEARRKGLQTGPTLLLLVDGVEFIVEADAEVRSAFHWLCQNGPSVGIWPIATLDSALVVELTQLVDQFQTYIVGRTSSRDAAHLFDLMGSSAYEALQTGFRFAVQVNADWILFDLLALEESDVWR